MLWFAPHSGPLPAPYLLTDLYTCLNHRPRQFCRGQWPARGERMARLRSGNYGR